MAIFYEHHYDAPGADRYYSVSAQVNVEEFDEWFIERVYSRGPLAMRRDLDSFLLLLSRMHNAGELSGYNFLFEMSEYDREEWVDQACRKLNRLYRDFPDKFPPAGIRESFDRLRAWRKAKSEEAKAAKIKKSQDC